jgi:hypothetical protein
VEDTPPGRRSAFSAIEEALATGEVAEDDPGR